MKNTQALKIINIAILDIKTLLNVALTRNSDRAGQISIYLTLIKIPIAIAIIALSVTKLTSLVPFLIMGAIIFDIADGEVFKKSNLNKKTSLRRARRIFDSATDRFLIVTTLIVATLYSGLDTTVFSLLIAREVLLLLVVAVPFFSERKVLKTNIFSKTGTAIMGIIGVFHYTGQAIPFQLLALFILFSIMGYFRFITHPEFVFQYVIAPNGAK